MVPALFDRARRLRVADLCVAPQSLRQSQKSRAKKGRVLEKSSSRSAHSSLPELLF
jgi:hypothetical protein